MIKHLEIYNSGLLDGEIDGIIQEIQEKMDEIIDKVNSLDKTKKWM